VYTGQLKLISGWCSNWCY